MKTAKFENEPIYIKAKEIYDTIQLMVDLLPDEDELVYKVKKHISLDSQLILVKLGKGISTKIYGIKMECATLIRKAAIHLKFCFRALTTYELDNIDYHKMVSKQLKEFKLLFIDWVSNFNPKHFITDTWGLFNPPGISHDYKQHPYELKFLDGDEGYNEY